MWQELVIAVSLLFVIEGMLPFLTPKGCRSAIMQIARMDDRSLRIMGLSSMLLGTALLYLVN